MGLHVAVLKGILNNGPLIFVIGHRCAGQVAGAGILAGGRADPGGKLRKIVGLEQPVQGLLVVAPVQEIVPLRDQVVERAAHGAASQLHTCLAEGHAAVAAPGRLLPPLPLGQRQVKLLIVLHPVRRPLRQDVYKRQCQCCP